MYADSDASVRRRPRSGRSAKEANGVNTSPLRSGGLYSHRSLLSPRGSAAPPDAIPLRWHQPDESHAPDSIRV